MQPVHQCVMPVRAATQGSGEIADDPLSTAALSTCLQVLEALSQFSMQAGLGVGDVRALLETAFVSAAQALLLEDGASDPDNVAKIANWTGLYRHSVRNQLKAPSQLPRTTACQHPGTTVIRAWQSLDGYFEGKGLPKILPIRGQPPSFHSLTKAAIGDDLPPKLILKDLHRIGAVKTLPHRRVQLIRTSYGNPAWDVHQVRQMGAEIGVHLRASLQLLQKRQPAPFQRYVVHDGLSPESAAILARELSRGASVIFSSHQRAVEHESAQASPGQKHRLSAAMVILREPVTHSVSPRSGATRRSRSAEAAPSTLRPKKKR